MAKKHPKRATAKKAASKPSQPTRRPAAKTAKTPTAKARAAVPATRPAPARPALSPGARPIGERAEQLRDEILRSKLTHPDPWTYTAKAREWGDKAQALVDLIAIHGETAEARRTLDALDADVQRDRDFQEARRLF